MLALVHLLLLCFSGGLVVKHLPTSARDAGDMGSVLGSRRSPGAGNSSPLQYSCLGNSMDRVAWRTTVHGIAKGYGSQISAAWRRKRQPTPVFMLGKSHGPRSCCRAPALGIEGFHSCSGTGAQLPHGMWDLPRPGIELVSLALQGRFLTTGPLEKPRSGFLILLVISAPSPS